MDGVSYGHWGAQDDMDSHALRFYGEPSSVAARLQYQEPSSVNEDLWTLPERNWHRGDMANQYWQRAFPIYPMPEFNPAYRPWGHIDDNIFNAIYEIKALWEYTVQEALHNYSFMYSRLRHPMDVTVLKQMCQRHKEVFAVYDRQWKTWLVESNEPKYRYCYSGEDFEDFDLAKERIGGNRLLLVGKYTILMQEPNLAHETRITYSMVTNFRRPSARLVVGVPGCGKTTYILSNHARGSLVLTSCAEAAADLRARMGRRHDCGESRFRNSYRTIDSYLLNSRRPYQEVWIDEALMEHPGKLFLVCLYSRCQTLHMLGDPNQLGYICRINGIHLFYEKAAAFFNATEVLNISYRCPVDVMAKISCKYDGGAFSTSHILRSMKCIEYTSLENVPKDNKTKYLVFKQAEKKAMLRAGYKVSTIHEFQGKEAKDVVVVRMSRNLQEPLYESVPHILVGLTRHRETLVYYTPVRDILYNLINMHLTDEQLRAHKKRTKLTSEPYSDSSDSQDYDDARPVDENSSLMRDRNAPSAVEKETSLITVRITRRFFSIVRWGVSTVRRAVSIGISACHWICGWVR
ncbi:uncharacterized protein [Choristoneura fumiferana]|uniref:uncharacterized protein n=1 Tax=Choristoneura fumiferana TaxID=7141 RepID=UPI003D15A011